MHIINQHNLPLKSMPAFTHACACPSIPISPLSQGISAFLKRRDHEAAFGEGSSLLPGMMLEVAVTTPGGAASGARTVNVTTDPTAVGSRT